MKTILLSTLIALFGLGLKAQTADVQIIHNSADAAASSVDVYLDGTLIKDDFNFREATAFLSVPAEQEIIVGIAGSNSTSVDDTLAAFSYNLVANENYIIVANGIISGSGYDPAQPFDLYVYPTARQAAASTGNTDVLVFHGSTDAPTVDIYETAVVNGELINDLAYTDFFGYAELATDDYVLEVRDETGTSTVAAYEAPLASLGLDDAAITVLASGFLNPANNSDGEAFGLYAATAAGGPLVELPLVQEAQVQIIHNSADAAAEMVDVYLNGDLIKDDFMFREATSFLSVPAEEEIVVGIAPSTSASVDDTIAAFNYTLTADEKYIIVANGIVSASGYDPAEAFDLYVFPMARDMAATSGNTDVLVFHGSTDAPVVDIYETAVVNGELIDNLAYGDFFGYAELATDDYVLEVRDETGTSTVAAYEAPLATLGLDDAAITVLASGFLNPANNSDGEAFGLYAALASGGMLVELPLVTEPAEAQVQIIHNSADAAAEMVDVYLNGDLIKDDFMFREATSFLSVPAEEEIVVGIAPSTSASVDDTIAAFNYTLTADEKYIIVANGIVSASGYDPAEAFDLYVFPMARDMAATSGNTDVLVFHGSTDAPVVDIYETAVVNGELIDNLAYGDFFGYAELATDDYVLEVRDETGTSTVAAYEAPLATLGLDDAAITVLASGFLNPANNSDGEAFGLYAALASGGMLVELPLVTEPAEAQVQIIHNSADAAAEMVDVYLNGDLIKDDFMFREATSFLSVPAEEEIVVGIAPSTSASVDDTIAAFNYTLTADEKYIIVANGIVSASGYDPAEAFDLYVFPMARDMAATSGNTDVLVFHGSTDAPVVDIYETAVVNGELIDNLAYGDFFGYAELATDDYVLEVRDETGTSTVAAYEAPLATLGLDDAAITVLASGFLNPANNSDGEAFGLYVALPSGGQLVALSAVGIFDNPQSSISLNVYPNPTSDRLNIASDSSIEKVEIFNAQGQIVIQRAANADKLSLNISDLTEGTYFVRVQSNNNVGVERIIKQ
ncbi:hypothetical protein L21SP5_03293 [Salinivirga cyanobacteriivorans]|uniref:Secretion system C-terminal sorting domain-containing protein n=1 Tax=Salinivirga cyanobacteriivorans TaxID=1307839 RepID=A0A0S2I3V9_9BACT|nr:DUF4397 domain-containing protein [Salinivirga cyanobacteriivorans]ALO16906.1 hypothetical protein L21SP5_03293 [Salinivirga cyanobacteriivorans]